MSTPNPDPLTSLFAAIRTWAEATALPAPAIYGLRQFFRYMTPTPPPTENQDALVFYPRVLDHDDSNERNHDSRSARVTSRGTQTQAAQSTEPTNDPLAPNNAGLRKLWRCCPATPYHACLSSTHDDDELRWRFHCGEHIPYDCLKRRNPARRRGETRPRSESSERIREISDKEVCPQCQCLLSRSEKNKNKVGKARRGRCDDCFRSMPAPVTDMGGPSYSSRIGNATTESTFTSHGEAGPSYPPCQHRARPQSVPCGHCAKINHHRTLRQTISLTNGFNSPACEHRGAGFLLPCDNCQEEKYDQYVRCRLLAENAAPFPADHFAAYEAEVRKAEKEKRIFQRRPTPITWCIRCNQDHCTEDCGTTRFEKEAEVVRGDTPIAAPIEEGYSSSETVRQQKILYSPALVRKIETRNRAIQTKQSRTRNRATQTEAEAIPLHAPSYVTRVAYLILLRAAASIALAGLAAIPGADARPLTATENFPSSAPGLLRAVVSVSLVIIASKSLFVKAAAAVTTIPELLEPTAVGATAFVAAIAAGYLLVRRPRPETEESVEVIDEAIKASENWEPFLRDISAPEFTEWKAGLISERHSKNALRGAILALYARLQASLDLGKRQGEFIIFLNAHPPGEDVLREICEVADKETGDWPGAIERIKK